MKYTCKKCGYSSQYKCAYENHLKRIMPCKPKTNICNVCNKHFSFPSGLSRHRKSCVTTNTIGIDEFLEVKKQLLFALNEIESLKQSKGNTNIHNNSTINHITINAYDSDKFNLSYEQLAELLKLKASRLITKLINDNHFNTNKPENMNFYISNFKDNIGRVFDGEDWGMKNAEILVDEVFVKYRDTIDSLISDILYASETNEELQTKKNIFVEKIGKLAENWNRDNDRKNFDDNMKSQLKEHIYSKKSLVVKTHKIK